MRNLAAVVGGRLDPSVEDRALITDVTHDSRQATGGAMFVAIPGAVHDGHDFVADAAAKGASAACVEHSLAVDVAQIVVDDTRKAIGPLAAEVHGNPSMELSVVGVTGTNGKTTVTHYLESLARSSGVTTGLIGTIDTRIAGRAVESTHTTPEASDFQRLLADMREVGVTLVAAEVSSHALELDRVGATRFAVAAFTNLSRDHLDFHGDMRSYLGAKRRLFEIYEVGTAVVNIDDPAGSEIAGSFGGNVLSVGSNGACSHSRVRATRSGTDFRLSTPWGTADVSSPVVGHFNLDNLVMASACALSAGIDFDDVVAGLPEVTGVPGRFEVVSGTDQVTVVVDYAHTPEGIAQAISAARALDGGRVIALLGAGGDRDRNKRPLMGRAASAADLVFVTSDNPRSEDPNDIIEAVVAGLEPSVRSFSEVDRRTAIRAALETAESEDVVLILGRGHEPSQEVAGRMIPFDDRTVARQALADLPGSADPTRNSGSMLP